MTKWRNRKRKQLNVEPSNHQRNNGESGVIVSESDIAVASASIMYLMASINAYLGGIGMLFDGLCRHWLFVSIRRCLLITFAVGQHQTLA